MRIERDGAGLDRDDRGTPPEVMISNRRALIDTVAGGVGLKASGLLLPTTSTSDRSILPTAGPKRLRNENTNGYRRR
jgi:hypothetical protein